ncbi:MAG: hypothetical protein KC643_07145 [Nitrospira sp.]|nr:hypothetical protein [Nitrospira sp.]MCA9465205.1 hypothetical protein [Nitrospira sp.]
MDTISFRSRMIKAFLIIGIFIAGFPFFLYFMMNLTSCKGIGGACGALTAGLGLILRPLALIIFGIVVVRAVYQRCRHVQISTWWSWVSLLWIAGSASFLIGFKNHWGANFSLGLLSIKPPVLLTFLMTFVIFLSFYDGRSIREVNNPKIKKAWLLSWLAVFLGLFTNIDAMKYPLGLVRGLTGQSIYRGVVQIETEVHQLLHLTANIQLALVWLAPTMFCIALFYIYFFTKGEHMPPANQMELQS